MHNICEFEIMGNLIFIMFFILFYLYLITWLSCIRTQPNPSLQEWVHIVKSLFLSIIFRIGALVKIFLIARSAHSTYPDDEPHWLVRTASTKLSLCDFRRRFFSKFNNWNITLHLVVHTNFICFHCKEDIGWPIF